MILTTEQTEALWDADGKPFQGYRVVSARPGTGKTSTLTQYCVDIADGWSDKYAAWQGMAVVSYTNVAKEELEEKLHGLGRARGLLSSPNFVGTIDSFMNQFIFLPYGAPKMGYVGGRPKLVGEPYSIFKSYDSSKKAVFRVGRSSIKRITQLDPTYYFDKSYTGVDGRIYPGFGQGTVDAAGKLTVRTFDSSNIPTLMQWFNNGGVESAHVKQIREYKEKMHSERGECAQADANYFALKALEESDRLTLSLAKRFPVLIIDEAQDMTEVQHRFLEGLKEFGQQHIVLIGDEYQAIYEWNTAKPQLFIDKSDDVDWNKKTISTTFRCSAPICSMLTALADDGVELAPSGDGKNVSYSDQVQIISYDSEDEQTKISESITNIAATLDQRQPHDDNMAGVKTVAVLSRSREDAARLEAYFTGTIPGKRRPIAWESVRTRDYLKIIHCLLRNDIYQAFQAYEALLFRLGGFESREDMRTATCLLCRPNSTDTFIDYRVVIYADLQSLKATLPDAEDMLVSQAKDYCGADLKALGADVLEQIRKDCQSFEAADKQDQDRSLSSLFIARDERTFRPHPDHPNVNVVFSTVHGVKGETYDGVIYYTKTRTGPCGCATPKQAWPDILQHQLVECEGKRITYVALSRAAQLLYIVAPQAHSQAWQNLIPA